MVFFFSSNGNLCEINDRYFCIFLITLSFFGIFFFRIFSPLFNPFSPRFIISARWWLTILLNRCHYLKTVNEELEVLDLFSEHLLVLHDVLSHSLRGCWIIISDCDHFCIEPVTVVTVLDTSLQAVFRISTVCSIYVRSWNSLKVV